MDIDGMDDYFNTKPKHDWTCNKCSAKIRVAFSFRLCDKCFEEFLEENERMKRETGKRTRELSDEEFKIYFLPPAERQN